MTRVDRDLDVTQGNMGPRGSRGLSLNRRIARLPILYTLNIGSPALSARNPSLQLWPQRIASNGASGSQTQRSRAEQIMVSQQIYHRGRLAFDRRLNPAVEQKARAAYEAYKKGAAHLLQRRVNGSAYEYILVERRRG
jgi:hypothetical protein